MQQANEGRKFKIQELQHLLEYHRTEALKYAEWKDVMPKPKAKAKI